MAATDKESLKSSIQQSFDSLMELLKSNPLSVWETNFIPKETKTKCTTFEQGENMRDVLMHIYEWQRLQVAFVENIRRGEPKDFIPDPYRKNYKEMDEVNRQKNQSVSFEKSVEMLSKSHKEIMALLASFSEEELFGKKVFKVTYTTTMAAYFVSVTQYEKAFKRAKAHKKAMGLK